MPPAEDKTILSVSELNRQARITIEQRFNQVWVMGEMSNFARPRSGHWYFSLKDEQAQVRCAMFVNRNRAVRMQPGDGQLVMVRGRVSLYEGRGDFQIIVDHMEPAGAGALRQAYDALKAKLADEGLFDAARKQALPRFPRHCAVVTSPSGAAIRDVLAVWQRRYPALRVTLIPTAVQGEQAETEIISALERAADSGADVVLLTRGGGSLEDLWSFNLEPVARALAACPLPTVCAVGHEIDISICDYVADLRAPTPSAAAELIVPDAAELGTRVFAYRRSLVRAYLRRQELLRLTLQSLRLRIASPERIVEQANQKVDDLGSRLQRSFTHGLEIRRLQVLAQTRQLQANGPAKRLESTARQLAELSRRQRAATTLGLTDRRRRLADITRMLQGLSPLPTLGRGYALVTDERGDVVSSTRGLSEQQTLTTYFAEGAVQSRVEHIDPDATLEDRQTS